MHAGVNEFLRVVLEPGNGQKCDAVIGPIVGNERSAGKLKVRLAADHDAVPIDHFLELGRLEIDMMHGGPNQRLVVGHVPLRLLALTRNRQTGASLKGNSLARQWKYFPDAAARALELGSASFVEETEFPKRRKK